jgi:NADPH:quinone reductase-like Zn-dependent oxidoreductase
MHAAVVRSFDAPPRYEQFQAPQPSGEHEIAVDVLAAGLHPRVRSGASGSHYTSTDALPLIPGIDGVARSGEGRLLYFVAFDSAFGSMAERTVIDTRRAVVLRDDASISAIAAGMNPGMSSWLALRKRISFAPGQKLLVLGATGNAGQMAVQIAKFLGAGHVVAAGRDAERLAQLRRLGADQIVSPSAALRAADVRILGSGQGSLRTAEIVAELPELADQISAGSFVVDPLPTPLSEVESAWSTVTAPGRRIVLTT